MEILPAKGALLGHPLDFSGASLTPMMFLKSCASRPIVSGVMSITERGECCR